MNRTGNAASSDRYGGALSMQYDSHVSGLCPSELQFTIPWFIMADFSSAQSLGGDIASIVH